MDVKAWSWTRILLVVAVLGAAGGCVRGPDGSIAEVSCVFIARFQGHDYTGVGVQIAPIEGRSLGTAVVHGCNDTGRATSTPDYDIPVAELPGVSPDVAVVWHGVSDRVLVRKALDHVPPEVARLQHVPPCDPSDEPIELSGPWLGIHDQDRTELDLIPPYQLDMLVQRASATRYERAYLTIQVPHSLGRPLTHEDVAASLWKGGTISIVAGCQGSRYVAERVQAFPPAG
jgi:hypothetical protein